MIKKFYCSKVFNEETQNFEFHFKRAKQEDYLNFSSLEDTIEHFKSLKLDATMWLRENGIFVSSIKTRIGDEQENGEKEVHVEIVHFEPKVKKDEKEEEWTVSDDCQECERLDKEAEEWSKEVVKPKEVLNFEDHSSKEKDVDGNCLCELCLISSSNYSKKDQYISKNESDSKTTNVDSSEIVFEPENEELECEECKLEEELGEDCHECETCDNNEIKDIQVDEVNDYQTDKMSATSDEKVILSSQKEEVLFQNEVIECAECNKMLEIENQNLINDCDICNNLTTIEYAKENNKLDVAYSTISSNYSENNKKEEVLNSVECEECIKMNSEDNEEECVGCKDKFYYQENKVSGEQTTNLHPNCVECQKIEEEILKWNLELAKETNSDVAFSLSSLSSAHYYENDGESSDLTNKEDSLKEKETKSYSSSTNNTNYEGQNFVIDSLNENTNVISGKVLSYNSNKPIKSSEYILVKKDTKEVMDVEIIDISEIEGENSNIVFSSASQDSKNIKESLLTRTNLVLWIIFWFSIVFIIITLLIFLGFIK